MSNPTFTIITPTFNRTKYLKECLDSVDNQTYKDFEYIIVNGNSNDVTEIIIEEFQK